MSVTLPADNGAPATLPADSVSFDKLASPPAQFHGITAIGTNGTGHGNGQSPAVEQEPAPDRHRMSRPTVSLVIPAKNEARNLAVVLENVPPCVDELILVDGRSSDVTQLMAVSCRPDIRIINEPEPGKGHALRAGFAAARGDFVVAMDADGSMSPAEIPQYLWFLEHGFDFVKGSRFVGGGGSLDITPLRKLGNRALLAVANTFYRTQLTDLCYGFFAFRRQYLDHLDLRSSGFEIETELTVRAVLAGLRIAEVPSMEMPRRSGRSSLRSFHDGQRVLRTLWRERSPRPGSGSAPAGPTLRSTQGPDRGRRVESGGPRS